MKRATPVLFALLLSACQTAPPATVAPQLSFDHLPKIALNVARIEVEDRYSAPMAPPHVDHLFRQPLEQVAKEMISRQFTANGSYNTLRIIIEDASVLKRDLPVTTGVLGALENEESEEYKAHVALRFELVADGGETVHGNATVTSDRMRTLLEDASPADRDMAFFRMTEQVRDDLQSGFTGTVKRTFGWR